MLKVKEAKVQLVITVCFIVHVCWDRQHLSSTEHHAWHILSVLNFLIQSGMLWINYFNWTSTYHSTIICRRKFGAFIIITNLTVYLLFLLLLMGLIIQFPTYTESPFCHIELVEVLLVSS
jgi:hypothetical protein